MANVQAIMVALQENKKKVSNAQGYAARTGKKKPRVKRVTSKPLGKVVGHCPNCQIVLGSKEAAHNPKTGEEYLYRCTRCKTELEYIEDLPKVVNQKKLQKWRAHSAWGDPSMPENLDLPVPFQFYNDWRDLV